MKKQQQKKAYLTIDDSPTTAFIPKMNYLHTNGIPAIFFSLGKQIEERREEIITAIKQGFVIGNHSYSHPFFSDLDIDQCRKEIELTDRIIESVYQEAGVAWNKKYFRFPYFDIGADKSGEDYQAKWELEPVKWYAYPRNDRKEAIQQILAEFGYTHPPFEGINMKYFDGQRLYGDLDVRCTFDQMEYYYGDQTAPYGLAEAEAILARMDEDVPYEGRSLNSLDTSEIILIHDHEHTNQLFYRIIDKYLEKQIEFQSIP
jgi:peptidoglycan/xylan/chitin deacetylase (PgdA/CDA1 family)